jgi:hypothetical protein
MMDEVDSARAFHVEDDLRPSWARFFVFAGAKPLSFQDGSVGAQLVE